MCGCLLQLLCIDVQLIVYRYLHEYQYRKLREQYRTTFVTRENNEKKHDIYWSDTAEMFVRLEGYYIVAESYEDFVFHIKDCPHLMISNIYTGVLSINKKTISPMM